MMENPDDQEAFEIATRALVYRYIRFVQMDLYWAMKACESPIERIMFSALAVIAVKKQIGMEFKEPGKIRHETHQYGKHLSMFTSDIMTFYPQAQLGEYRVDFLLEYEQIHTKYPPQPNLPTTREEMIKQMEELVEQLNLRCVTA
jgi:hypothetical protein